MPCSPTCPGELLGEVSAQLDVAEGPAVVLGWVVESVRSLLRKNRRKAAELAAIGIGLPGPVEHSTGRPINPPIMPGWDRYDVPGHVQRHYAVPVLIDNDVNIMALGERRTHLADVDDLVLIKVATGIGAGIVSGGSSSAAPRAPPATSATCGSPAPATSSAAAATSAASRRSPPVRRSPPALRARGIDARNGQDVVDLVRAGDGDAIAVVRQAGRDIGDVVATMVNLINPSVVVIGGQLAAAGEHLLAGIREVVYQRSLPLATEHLQHRPLAGRRRGRRPRRGRHGHRARALPRGDRGRQPRHHGVVSVRCRACPSVRP